MIHTFTQADPAAMEAGLKRLKLRRLRENLEEITELALQEEPSYLDFLAYIVDQEVKARDET